jgi:hypothetical protein
MRKLLIVGITALFTAMAFAAEVGGVKLADKGAIPGEAFNRALTRIGLGEKPAQADLKTARLGG